MQNSNLRGQKGKYFLSLPSLSEQQGSNQSLTLSITTLPSCATTQLSPSLFYIIPSPSLLCHLPQPLPCVVSPTSLKSLDPISLSGFYSISLKPCSKVLQKSHLCSLSNSSSLIFPKIHSNHIFPQSPH